MTTVLVAARGAARARLEAVVGAARALRLLAGQPEAPLARRLQALRPDVVLLDLDGGRLDAVLGELPAAVQSLMLQRSPSI